MAPIVLRNNSATGNSVIQWIRDEFTELDQVRSQTPASSPRPAPRCWAPLLALPSRKALWPTYWVTAKTLGSRPANQILGGSSLWRSALWSRPDFAVAAAPPPRSLHLRCDGAALAIETLNGCQPLSGAPKLVWIDSAFTGVWLSCIWCNPTPSNASLVGWSKRPTTRAGAGCTAAVRARGAASPGGGGSGGGWPVGVGRLRPASPRPWLHPGNRLLVVFVVSTGVFLSRVWHDTMRELDGQAASIEPRLSGAWILFALCFVALHRTIFFSASRL